MNYLRLLGIAVLFVFVGLGTVGGCGGSGGGDGDGDGNGDLAGEINCMDGIDNDGDTETDCSDIDCILDPFCIMPAPVVLLTPVNDAIIQQNNPNIGCPFNPTRGFGWRIFFDWTDSSSPNGINGYHLFVQHMDSVFPVLDTFVQDSNFTDTSCNSFVIDANLNDWIWTVQAEDNMGILSPVATGEFMFGPCRLADGTICNAPAIPPAPVANVTTPVLLTPVNDEIIQQNNPNIGCPFNPTFGFGFRLFFDWTDSSSPNGIRGYHLFVKGTTIDIFVLDSNFMRTSCNTFVIDPNLNDWIWTVQAEDNMGILSPVATGEFMFGPCRLADGTPCNAPP